MDIIYGHICIMFLMCDVVIINNEKSLKTTLAFVANTSQKMKFPLRISSVNVIKSAENCGFGHIY